MRSHRNVAIVLIACGLFGTLAWTCFLSLKTARQHLSHAERKNRIALVRNLLNEYAQHSGNYRDDDNSARTNTVSWRVNLLNGLNEASPEILKRHPSFDLLRFPLGPDSPRPACFGTDQLSVFRVTSPKGSHWNEPRRQSDDPIKDNPIILVDIVSSENLELSWGIAHDLAYTETGIVISNASNVIQEFTTISDILLLRSNGHVEWIEGPLDANDFANVLCQ